MNLSRPYSSLLAVSVCGWAVLGAVFVFKYGLRITPYALWLSIAYVVLALVGWGWAANGRVPRSWLMAGLLVWSAALAAICARVAPGQLQNDRWSMLQTFWDTTFRGEHSFLAVTHLGERVAAFPALYATLLPFYLLGAYALQAWLGALLVLWRSRWAAVAGLGLMFSPMVAYEVVARSTLLWNAALVVLALRWAGPRLVASNVSFRKAILLGAVLGALLFTRSLVGVPLAVLAGYLIVAWRSRSGWGRTLQLSLAMLAGVLLAAVLTLLPWFAWDPDVFLRYSPLARQQGFASGWMVASVLLLALGGGAWLGRKVAGMDVLLLVGGLLCWLSVIFYAIPIFQVFGWRAAILDSHLDISYFVFGLAFVVAAWAGLLDNKRAAM